MFGRSRLLSCSTSGMLVEVDADLRQVLAQVLEALDVRVEHRHLRVGDEHDPVDALEHELARGVVEDLAGDGVELEAGLEAADHADVDRAGDRRRACGRSRSRG